jgi:hypothetical protein
MNRQTTINTGSGRSLRARDRHADVVDLVLAQLGEPHPELGEIQARRFLVVSLSRQPSWVA